MTCLFAAKSGNVESRNFTPGGRVRLNSITHKNDEVNQRYTNQVSFRNVSSSETKDIFGHLCFRVSGIYKYTIAQWNRAIRLLIYYVLYKNDSD